MRGFYDNNHLKRTLNSYQVKGTLKHKLFISIWPNLV
jgi:hypothetical protein